MNNMPPTPEPTMPPKPERIVLPADENIIDFYQYLKNRRDAKGMESITKADMDTFYELMENPNAYSIEPLESLFVLLEQLAGSESFESKELALEVVRQIGFYKEELGL